MGVQPRRNCGAGCFSPMLRCDGWGRNMIRLQRTGPKYLDVVGAVCQIKRKWESEPCGGALCVEDHRGNVTDMMWNYELFCVKCGVCDPNGWRTQAEVREAAAHFGRE